MLIGTDFSPTARNAALYGTELAKALKARIILVSAYEQMPIPASAATLIVTAEDVRRNVQERLDQEALYIGMGIDTPVETVCVEGLATVVILETAKKTNADLIILGVKVMAKAFKKSLAAR